MDSQITDLIHASILRLVKYQTWVSHPVMVKKVNGIWSMCVDFTSLNNACSKDNYPLPPIDWKVESLADFKYKCFLDAHKGYHHILMKEFDEDKTAFYTK